MKNLLFFFMVITIAIRMFGRFFAAGLISKYLPHCTDRSCTVLLQLRIRKKRTNSIPSDRIICSLKTFIELVYIIYFYSYALAQAVTNKSS